MLRVCCPGLAWLAALALALLVGVAPRAALAGDPSPEYQAALRRTAELRKQRRQAREALPAPVGIIVPYPLPPSLIIRQTPEVHDQIAGLLWQLRH
jgi:hypothetical protein